MPKIKSKRKSGIRSKYAGNEDNSVETKEESNLAKLLLHELKKGDTHAIKAILCVDEEKIVESLWKLRNNIVEELLEKLVTFMQKNRLLKDAASLWIQQLLKTNATHLMNKPNIGDMLTPLTIVLQEHIDFQKSLKGVQGNINYILNHTNRKKSDEVDEEIISNEDSDDNSIEQFNMHSPESYSSDDLKDDLSDDLRDDNSEDVKDGSSEEE